jgi:hypothetical protein
MRSILLIAGLLAMLMGLVWAAQGAGYFPYPAASFMVNQSPWIYIGLAVAAAGLVAVLLSRRL